ncbi:MAG: homocysteine S-methyltransferase family protein [Thermosulfidibacteraceae bacterium]
MKDFGKRILIIDGAMGTLIQSRKSGYRGAPELLNKEDPELIKEIHLAYIEAGADIIETNTFGANRIKLSNYNLEHMAYELAYLGAKIAREVAKDKAIVAGSVGPLGRLLWPVGDIDFKTSLNAFKEQIKGLKDGGADIIFIETMSDVREAKSAIIAANELEIPCVVMMTFQEDGRTLLGSTPEAAAIALSSMDVLAVGSNCSFGPDLLINIAQRMASVTSKPLVFMPNAGLPKLIDGKTVFPMGPEKFLSYMDEFISLGTWMIGGCCGTTPEHIKLLANRYKESKPLIKPEKPFMMISGRDKITFIGKNQYPVIIGERINPTGKKDFIEDLKNKRASWAIRAAQSQKECGAEILDVNVGTPGIDEAELLPFIAANVQMATGLPIMIDSSNIEAIERTLEVIDGRSIINSTTAEEKKMESLLPLAKKFGSAILVLPTDERGIPEVAKERIELGKKVLYELERLGLKVTDMLFDCLVTTVAAENKGALITLETLKLAKAEGFITVMGVSNVSYGLPNRKAINMSFLAASLIGGLDSAIVNPEIPEILEVFHASALIAGRDEQGRVYISKYGGQKEVVKGETKKEAYSKEEELKLAVIEGDSQKAEELTGILIKEKDSLDIINNYLIPAMEEVGKRYERGIYFLPQLVASAKAMQAAFKVIKENMKGKEAKTKGKVILATVEGDIHDIGKNIVGMLLENNGYEVIDLGKNVPTRRIVEEAKKIKPLAVGLSALMTTTMQEMRNVIKKLKKEGIKTFTIVGGAVVTEEFAREIGADAYGKDALSAVKILDEWVKKNEKSNNNSS